MKLGSLALRRFFLLMSFRLHICTLGSASLKRLPFTTYILVVGNDRSMALAAMATPLLVKSRRPQDNQE
jgi:hypothetical protein